MLHSPFNYGVMRAFGEEQPGRHAPLLSYDLFLQMRVVDGELGQNISHRNKYNPAFPLLHSLKCPECGMALRASFSRGKLGKRYPYYHHNNSQCSLAKSYRQKTAHDAFLELLQELKPQAQHFRLVREVVLDVAKQKAKQQKKDIDHFAARKKQTVHKKEQLIEFKISDPNDEAISREDFLSRMRKFEQELRDVQQERVKQGQAAVNIPDLLDRFFAVITDPEQRWKTYQKVEHKLGF